MRPLVGLTLDAEQAGGWSAAPWYALRQNYAAAVVAAGGLPICLPHHPELADEYVARLDALIVTGGAFDVDPTSFGASATHPSVKLKPERTAFEWRALELGLARELPVLGICGGAQLLNVVLGGTLIQHIPAQVIGALSHEQTTAHDQPSHLVRCVDGSLLAALVGAQVQVNSTHHQAVERLGRDLRVAARAPDGVIEAVEHTRAAFCVGVQWHPEYFVGGASGSHGLSLFRGLIAAACQRISAAVTP